MRMIVTTMVLAGVLAASCAGTPPHASNPTPVEIWRSGDDGLTVRFEEAVDAAFEASPLFSKSSGKQTGTLIVTIPSNVDWEPIGERVRVSFKVAFTDTAGRNLGTNAGSCWEDELSTCANEVVGRAEDAARSLTRSQP